MPRAQLWWLALRLSIRSPIILRTQVLLSLIHIFTGSVLGIQMGYSLVNILDPQTQVDTPVVAMFYQCIAMLLFLGMDVHLWLLRAVGNSFRYVPPGTAHLSSLFTTSIIRTVGEMFGLGVQIAAPVLSATLAADVILGLLGKASPNMPLTVSYTHLDVYKRQSMYTGVR